MTETRARIAKGEQIIVSAASLGELERFADLCHEYELAYQLTEVEESVAGARLAEDSTAGTVAGAGACAHTAGIWESHFLKQADALSERPMFSTRGR